MMEKSGKFSEISRESKAMNMKHSQVVSRVAWTLDDES